jgi:hypothetical protein
MKKAILAILGITVLCILGSTMIFGTVSAAKAGYGFTIGPGTTDATFNGAVAAGEWEDAYKDWLYNGWATTTSFFRCKWGQVPAINEGWLIEVPTDTTNDAGDYVKIFVDNAPAGDFAAVPAGGTAPTAACFVVTVTGAGAVTIQKGTGTAWGPFAEPVSGTDYSGFTSVSASPASATVHRVFEIYLAKTGLLAMGFNNNVRIEAYDASTGQTVMWPPYSSADVPNDYGLGTTAFTGDTVPEGLTIGVMVLLSSVAVIVSTRYFRKRA